MLRTNDGLEAKLELRGAGCLGSRSSGLRSGSGGLRLECRRSCGSLRCSGLWHWQSLDGKADRSRGSSLLLYLLGLEELLRLRNTSRGCLWNRALSSSSLGSSNDSESILVQRGVKWIRGGPWAGGRLTSLVEGLEHKEGVLSGLGPSRSWLGCSRSGSRNTHSCWLCGECCGNRGPGRGLRSCSRDVQGLEVKLEGSSGHNTSIAGLSRSRGRSRCANGWCRRGNSGGQCEVIVSN